MALFILLLALATLANVFVRSFLYWLDDNFAPGARWYGRIGHSVGLGIHDALRVNNGRAAILFTMAVTCTVCLPYVVMTRPSLTGLAVDQATRLQSQPPHSQSRPEKLVNKLLYGDANHLVDASSMRSQYEPVPAFYTDWNWWKMFFFLWAVFPVYGMLSMREEIGHLWSATTRHIHRQHRTGHVAPGSSWIAQLIMRNLPVPQTQTSGAGNIPAQTSQQSTGTARVLFWAIVADFVVAFVERMFRRHHHD